MFKVARQNRGQFLFYSHLQFLMFASQKPKQTWSAKSFSAFAMLKRWPSTQEHTFLNESGDCRGTFIPPFEVRFCTVSGKLVVFNIIEQKV